MRRSQFSTHADARYGVTVETGRLYRSQPWSGQSTEPIAPPGRRIDRTASPYLKPFMCTSDAFLYEDSVLGTTRRRRFFTTPLC
jgi:hypothetical protein